MNGLQIFNLLLAQRCPMPVIFLTGPHGNDMDLALDQVGLRGRADVHFFSKQAPLDKLKDKIRLFLAREPALRREAEEERRLLQLVLDVLTPAEREVISRVLRGQTNYGIARELNKEEGVGEVQRARAVKKLLAAAAAAGPTRRRGADGAGRARAGPPPRPARSAGAGRADGRRRWPQ